MPQTNPAIEARSKPIDYKGVRDRIKYDGEVLQLRESHQYIRAFLEEATERIDRVLKVRMAKIAMESGMAFAGINTSSSYSITNAFPEDEYIERPERVDGVDLRTFTRNDGARHTVYFSRPLGGVWVRGEPERREDGLYCQITGEKISTEPRQ